MKIKKIIMCCLLLSLCGCNTKSNENSSELAKERFYTIELDVSFFGQDYPNFNEKYLNTCLKDEVISSKVGKLDYEKYNIDFDNLIAGECICIETSTFNQYSGYHRTDKSWNNHLSFDGEVFNMYVKKAEVVELIVEKKNDQYRLVNENDLNIEYSLSFINYQYVNSSNEEDLISPVFHSLLGGEDFTLLEDLEEGTKVYGTYIKEDLKNNRCPLYGLYSFNPYK